MKKFIKKLVKKYLQKYVGRELTQMDNRIYDLEVKLGTKHFEIRKDTFTQAITGDIAVKDAEYLKASPEPKMTHPELPAKWCVRVTKANVKVLEEWREQGKNSLSATPIGGFLHYDKIWAPTICDSVEVSFSDFQRLVLKKGEAEENVQEVDFEIDWSVPGQFINIAYGNYASTVVTNGKHDNSSFEGMCIASTLESQIGNFSSRWSKDIPGSVTLKN